MIVIKIVQSARPILFWLLIKNLVLLPMSWLIDCLKIVSMLEFKIFIVRFVVLDTSWRTKSVWNVQRILILKDVINAPMMDHLALCAEQDTIWIKSRSVLKMPVNRLTQTLLPPPILILKIFGFWKYCLL